MLEYGTQVVAGVTPGKGGQTVHGLPVYNSVGEAMANHQIDLSVIFVPARFTKGAALEAIEAGVPDVIVLTEFIPVHDVMEFLAAAKDKGTRIIGPNCPGVVFPGRDFMGIMPGWSESLFKQGDIGVVSRSGSLGALINLNLVSAGFGQSGFIGIGGDPIVGTTFRDVLEMFDADPDTKAIVMLGEVGGPMEEEGSRIHPPHEQAGRHFYCRPERARRQEDGPRRGHGLGWQRHCPKQNGRPAQGWCPCG